MRAGVYGCVPMLVAMFFGLDPSWGMLHRPVHQLHRRLRLGVRGISIAGILKVDRELQLRDERGDHAAVPVAGTFFPLAGLPDWAQVLAQLNPLYHCVQLVRDASSAARAGSTSGTSRSSSASAW